MINSSDIIRAILEAEGSEYTDRASDAGGPTKFGITLNTLSAYRKRPCTAPDVQALTVIEATGIYEDRYINAPGFALLTDGRLESLMVDSGVQHGVPEAVKMLQRAAYLDVDGKLGQVSLAKINLADAESAARLRGAVCAARVRLYGNLIAHDPQLVRARSTGLHLQAENAAGWANRIASFIEEAA